MAGKKSQGNEAFGKARSATPVRAILVAESPLRAKVQDGLGALQGGHLGYLDEQVRAEFSDSLDLDAALAAQHPQANRWDYLLGHASRKGVIGLEPHSAKHDQVSTIIAKKKAAKDQFKPHLKEGARILKWLWVASGKVHFADTEDVRRRLDQVGIEFVGQRVLKKHLEA